MCLQPQRRMKNVPCSLAYLCTDIATHRHTHRLPGLCHGAAVAATAPRTPAHPQLLSRLTPIKVVCEFPKTRHLASIRLPPPSCLCLSLFLWAVKRRAHSCPLYTTFLTYCLSSSASTWVRYRGISRRSEYPCAPSSSGARHFNVQTNEPNLTLPVSASPFLGRSCATTRHERMHWLSQNSNICNCPPIDAARAVPPQQTRGKREGEEMRGRRREVTAQRRSASVCWRRQS